MTSVFSAARLTGFMPRTTSVRVKLRSMITELRMAAASTVVSTVCDRICARTTAVTIATIKIIVATTATNTRHDIKTRGSALAADLTTHGNERRHHSDAAVYGAACRADDVRTTTCHVAVAQNAMKSRRDVERSVANSSRATW